MMRRSLSPLANPAVRSLATYALATALAAALTLVITRVVWLALTPDAFGLWALIDPLILPAASLLLLGADHAIVKQLRTDKVPLPVVTGQLLVGGAPLGVLGPVLFAVASVYLFHLAWTPVLLAGVAGEALVLLGQTALRANGAVGGYATALLARNLLYLAGVLAAWWVHPSIETTFLARGASVLLTGLATIVALRPALRVNWPAYGDAVRYGLPLLLTVVVYAASDMADRWFVATFVDLAAAGVYAIHLKLAAIVSQAIVIPFGMWFAPERFRRMADPDEGRDFFIRTSVVLAVVCSLLSGCVWLAREPLLRMIAPSVSVSGLALICCLGSVVCLAMSQALNVGMLLPGQTAKNLWCVGIAVLVSISACWLLVPRWGMNGAAISRLLGGVAMLATTTVWSNRIFAVAFPLSELILYSVICIVALLLVDSTVGRAVGAVPAVATWIFVSGSAGTALLYTRRSRFRLLPASVGQSSE